MVNISYFLFCLCEFIFDQISENTVVLLHALVVVEV